MFRFVWSFFRASIATGYGLGDGGVGVRVPVGSIISFSPRRPDRPWGQSQPHIQWVPGALFTGVKRQGREADHLLSTSADDKKVWMYCASTPPYAFIV
jgi:hypothetical protein